MTDCEQPHFHEFLKHKFLTVCIKTENKLGYLLIKINKIDAYHYEMETGELLIWFCGRRIIGMVSENFDVKRFYRRMKSENSTWVELETFLEEKNEV